MYSYLLLSYAHCSEGGIYARVPKDRVKINSAHWLLPVWLHLLDNVHRQFMRFAVPLSRHANGTNISSRNGQKFVWRGDPQNFGTGILPVPFEFSLS